MAFPYASEDPPEIDEPEHESADEDFNPESASVAESSGTSDDEDNKAKPSRRGKRKAVEREGLDSGDEFTIENAKRRKARNSDDDDDDDDDLLLSDGEGALIKTRAQRLLEQKERRPLAKLDGATVDVDALWAQMTSETLQPLYPVSQTTQRDDAALRNDDAAMVDAHATVTADETDTVAVKKVYTFAGQRTTEEKDVPRSSLEQHLADGWTIVEKNMNGETEAAGDMNRDVEGIDLRSQVRRPLRRASRFDPNPSGYVRALALEHQLVWPRKSASITTVDQENISVPELAQASRVEKAQKLNVVDKSRLDWTGFVDKEGIADELTTHAKTKEAYLGRMQFLNDVEARREEERLKAKASLS
jgi:hypothetical protein